VHGVLLAAAAVLLRPTAECCKLASQLQAYNLLLIKIFRTSFLHPVNSLELSSNVPSNA
jgi:hypothetical protein